MKEKLIIPQHVAIILDGNRRWARKRGLPQLEGHRRGFDNICKLAPYVINKGVKYLSVYAFSMENFNRSPEEVKYLMDIFVEMFNEKCQDIHKENIKVVFSGIKDKFRSDVVEAMDKIVEMTKNNTKGVFNICLGYSGQQEITDMVKKVCVMYKNSEIDLDDIDTKFVQHNLYQDLPPVDFLIRTSGELRLSNFMLYQASYAEFYFPPIMFPDFNEKEFDKALIEFNNRNRRYGK